ncbi:Ldh family oxidoreductase [Ancylobacter amanitiformis]|uniref:(2R)-3-sulfolactate dehydrogenase (NADP+) n=1 Tax=Ancylobacter amanitiformis TaxID=217069 RepID=A0ABU0LSS7_9HYPH|nr:Ldh family oxidoreductase [Ancylobacter amanitiformis]MDQ0511734.1 (2R)-3-sulfolactate dehydrogenase (NADP+) [Ancylobacter amanitiformis]
MPLLTLDEIETFARDALTDCGASAPVAASVSRSVRRAEADGIGSVGLGYLGTYLAHLKSGKVDGRAEPRVNRARAGAVLADARHGFAHPAFDLARPVLVEAAQDAGTATLAIRRSYSIGVVGHPVEDLAEAGLIALAFTNSPPNIAPWGGRKPLFGTNPLAFAAPRRAGPPIVIDLATSQVTKVSLVAAAKAGTPLPEGWALDAEGQPTTDPAAALSGSMAPFGGAKGAAVALIVEILAAGLTGANFSKDASAYARTDGPPPGVGQCIVAFDPSAFADGFAERIEDLIGAIHAQEGARLPGARRLAAREASQTRGVEVDAALLTHIEKIRFA